MGSMKKAPKKKSIKKNVEIVLNEAFMEQSLSNRQKKILNEKLKAAVHSVVSESAIHFKEKGAWPLDLIMLEKEVCNIYFEGIDIARLIFTELNKLDKDLSVVYNSKRKQFLLKKRGI